jgi:hypothetical protein
MISVFVIVHYCLSIWFKQYCNIFVLCDAKEMHYFGILGCDIYCFAVKFTILPRYVQATHGNRRGKHLLNAGYLAPYHRLQRRRWAQQRRRHTRRGRSLRPLPVAVTGGPQGPPVTLAAALSGPLLFWLNGDPCGSPSGGQEWPPHKVSARDQWVAAARVKGFLG